MDENQIASAAAASEIRGMRRAIVCIQIPDCSPGNGTKVGCFKAAAADPEEDMWRKLADWHG
jgi:hypothetical protein